MTADRKKEGDIGRMKWLSNRQFIVVMIFLVPLIFSSGILWRDISSMPRITQDQWDATYKYSVVDESDRRQKYMGRINNFEKKDLMLDARLCTVEKSQEEMKQDIKLILSIVRKLEKK